MNSFSQVPVTLWQCRSMTGTAALSLVDFPACFDIQLGEVFAFANGTHISCSIPEKLFVGVFFSSMAAIFWFHFCLRGHGKSSLMVISTEGPLANRNAGCIFEKRLKKRLHRMLADQGVTHLKGHQHGFGQPMQSHPA